jgi:hypothetical protein
MARKKPEAPAQTQILEQTPPEPVTTTQIVRLEPPSIVLPLPPTPDEVIKQAADQIYIFKQYMKLFAREVRPEQVLLFGEQIYLPARACQTLLGYARLRLKIHSPITQHRFNSPDGEFIVFEAHATICTREGVELDDVVASQSTRDEFFGISGKDYVCPDCKGPTTRKKANPNDKWDSSFCATHGKVKAEAVTHYLPLYDVPIDDVLKKTTTNVFNRALQAIGMMPRIEDLQDAGMDISKVKRIGFKDNKASSPQPPPRQAAPSTSAPASETPHTPAAASTTGPPRATIPKEQTKVFGGIQQVVDKIKKDQKTHYRVVIVNGVTYYLFDNMTRVIDTKGNKRTMFEILDAAAQGTPGEFIVEVSTAPGGETYPNIKNVLRVGNIEWEPDGMLVLRRDAPPPEPGSYEASEDDFPAGLF